MTLCALFVVIGEWLIMLVECFIMLLRFLETYQLHPRNVTQCLRLEPAPEVRIMAYGSEILLSNHVLCKNGSLNYLSFLFI